MNLAEHVIKGLEAYDKIAELWQLTSEEKKQLLYGNREPNSSIDDAAIVVMNLSYIIRIYKYLQILFKEPEHADGWIKRPNKAFPSTALNWLLKDLDDLNPGLLVVTQCLAAQCH